MTRSTRDRPHYTPGDLLGVHVISEHVFCPRAMLTTHAADFLDTGRETSILRFDYAPCYELAELEKRLNDQANLLWQLVVLAGTFVVSGFLLSLFFHWSFLWAGVLAAFIPARYFLQEVKTTLRLLRDHRLLSGIGLNRPGKIGLLPAIE